MRCSRNRCRAEAVIASPINVATTKQMIVHQIDQVV
jgi:hypothetical protein